MIYQEEQELMATPSSPFCFATVAGVYADGLTLLFPGESEAGEKRYRCNIEAVFSVGDRVFVAKDSGTCVVLFPVQR